MTINNKTLQPGFSFMEMVIALMIMGLILSTAVPQLFKLLGKGQRTTTQSTLKVVAGGIKQYKMDVGTYPEKLEDLIKKPETANNWQGPYAGSEDTTNPTLPLDAWNQPLVYKRNAAGTVPPFELYSNGDPDKEEDRISYAK